MRSDKKWCLYYVIAGVYIDILPTRSTRLNIAVDDTIPEEKYFILRSICALPTLVDHMRLFLQFCFLCKPNRLVVI